MGSTWAATSEALCWVASWFRVSVGGMLAARMILMALRALWLKVASPRARVEISVRKDCTSGSTEISGRSISVWVSRLRMMTPLLPTRALRRSPTMPSARRSRKRGKSFFRTKP